MANNQSPGALFEEQTARGQLDVFSVLGLAAETPEITVQQIKLQFILCLKHVFERQKGQALTTARNVPTWAQLNVAKENLSSKQKILHAVDIWKYTSVQVWNPLAPVGSAAAKVPLTSTYCR